MTERERLESLPAESLVDELIAHRQRDREATIALRRQNDQDSARLDRRIALTARLQFLPYIATALYVAWRFWEKCST